MDEEELELYLDLIDSMDPLLSGVEPVEVEISLREQLRDEDSGYRVDGCYRVNAAPTE